MGATTVSDLFAPYEDWEVRSFNSEFHPESRSPQEWVTDAMSTLLHEARILPTLFWFKEEASPRLMLALGGPRFDVPPPDDWSAVAVGRLFASLVAQLASVIQRPDSIGRCIECGEVMATRDGRALRSDRDPLCPEIAPGDPSPCQIKARQRRDREHKRAVRAAARAAARVIESNGSSQIP
jgi:hypothetical protein